MDKRLIARWALGLLCGVGAFPLQARECAPQMKEGWVRLPPAAMPMMAGFGRIANPCPMPVVIVSASSPAFADVSLHETRIVEGVSRMREVSELRIPSDDAATLKPGGLHLMLMQPHAPLKEGSKVVVKFKLQDGREILAELVARKPVP